MGVKEARETDRHAHTSEKGAGEIEVTYYTLLEGVEEEVAIALL